MLSFSFQKSLQQITIKFHGAASLSSPPSLSPVHRISRAGFSKPEIDDMKNGKTTTIQFQCSLIQIRVHSLNSHENSKDSIELHISSPTQVQFKLLQYADFPKPSLVAHSNAVDIYTYSCKYADIFQLYISSISIALISLCMGHLRGGQIQHVKLAVHIRTQNTDSTAHGKATNIYLHICENVILAQKAFAFPAFQHTLLNY